MRTLYLIGFLLCVYYFGAELSHDPLTDFIDQEPILPANPFVKAGTIICAIMFLLLYVIDLGRKNN